MTCFKIECGSRKRQEIEIDMDSLGKRVDTGATEDQKAEALNCLADHLQNALFTTSGFRNDQAVNTCISLHVLGYEPDEWFGNFFEISNDMFYSWNIAAFMEHVERVSGYLSAWGPSGSEGLALDYRL